MKMKLLSLGVITIALVTSFILWNGTGSAKAQQPPGGAMPPMEVAVITIKPVATNLTKELPGRTSPFKIAEIRPQVSGIIVKRLFEEGSDVTEGQQLYQIDPATYQAVLASAKADLMKAEANSKSIIAKADRYKQLVEIGGVSKQEYDDIKASVAQANADIEIAKAALATAKINLDYTKVLSPIAGRIGKSQFTEGALVTQNQVEPLTTVQQLDPIYVDVTQSSAELMSLQRQASGNGIAQEMPVMLTVEGDTHPSEQKGKLQFSDASVDPTTGSIQMRILFPNPDHQLLPGMFVRARIGQSKDDNAILVPQQAVSRSADGSAAVMIVGEGNKVAPQPVKLGDAVGDKWLVIDGLKEGDKVIVEGMKAAPGSVVKPVEKATDQPQPAKE